MKKTVLIIFLILVVASFLATSDTCSDTNGDPARGKPAELRDSCTQSRGFPLSYSEVCGGIACETQGFDFEIINTLINLTIIGAASVALSKIIYKLKK